MPRSVDRRAAAGGTVVGEHEAGGRRVRAGAGTVVREAQGRRRSPSSGTAAAWETSRAAGLGALKGNGGL
jgi:hypothetical protein